MLLSRVGLLAVFLAGSSPLLAAAITPGEVELTRTEIQTERKSIVEANMSLDDKTAAIFWPLYNDYQNGMRKVSDRGVKLLMDYAGNWQDLTDAKAKSLLDEYFQVQAEKIKVRTKYISQFRKSLPEKVVSRFFQIDNKLDAIINYELAAQVPLVH